MKTILSAVAIVLLFASQAFAGQLCVTVPDPVDARVLDGVAGQYKYQATIKDAGGATIPNPETKAQFVKRVIRGFVKQSVVAYEAGVAAETARQNAVDQATSDIELN